MNKQEAERQVDRWLTDAHYDRERGVKVTDAQMLRERLIDALTDPGQTDPHAGRRS